MAQNDEIGGPLKDETQEKANRGGQRIEGGCFQPFASLLCFFCYLYVLVFFCFYGGFMILPPYSLYFFLSFNI